MHGLARILCLTAVAPILVSACAAIPSGGPPATPVAVRTATVTPGSITGAIVYSGNVTSRNRVSVLPKIAGQITVLNVDVGSPVKKGDVIAELDHAALDAQVDQARAALAAAQAKLAQIQAGPRPETVAQAEANLRSAKAALAAIEQGGRPENVQAAQGNLDAAIAKLNGLKQGRAEMIAQARANLASAEARLQQLKDGPTADQIREAQLAVEQAKDAAYAADVQKDAACNPAAPQALCKAAQAAAFAAHTGVDQAQAHLKTLTDPPTATQLAQAQAAVDAARAQLAMAEQPGSASDIAAAAGAVEAARAQLALARAPYTSADLAKAQAAVDVAQQQLELARKPYTKQDEAAAQAAVQQAQAALEAALVARDQALIKAPIDGVVAQKLLSVGAMAAPTTPIVTIIDPHVDVTVNVDTQYANQIHPDQSATIIADVLGGKSIPARVTAVAPAVDPQTRTVMVRVTPTDPSAGLKDGMLVRVSLATATHQGVLTVPSTAVVNRGGQSQVFVVVNGIATPRTVSIGLSDGSRTEITSGLKAGDTIVVSGQDRLTDAQPVIVQP